MSERTKEEALDREDRAVLTALARVMASGTGVPVPRAASDADETLVREYLEILGLLSYGLEPETPSPAVKERLLASLGAPSAVAGPQRSFDEVTFAGKPDRPVDVTLHGQTAIPSGSDELGSGRTIPFPVERQRPAPPRRQNRWTAALAAALVFCIAGLAYLTGKVNEQTRTIARLSEELRGIPVSDLASLHAELETMQRRFNMVTAVARRAYHLQGVDPVPSDEPIDGVVYVCGKHQRWYLNVQGLAAAPEGKEYHLWFVTDHGMVDGGVLPVGDDDMAEMEAPTMPDGTHGFAITLEEIGDRGDDPSGMMVLLGEESVSL